MGVPVARRAVLPLPLIRGAPGPESVGNGWKHELTRDASQTISDLFCGGTGVIDTDSPTLAQSSISQRIADQAERMVESFGPSMAPSDCFVKIAGGAG